MPGAIFQNFPEYALSAAEVGILTFIVDSKNPVSNLIGMVLPLNSTMNKALVSAGLFALYEATVLDMIRYRGTSVA